MNLNKHLQATALLAAAFAAAVPVQNAVAKSEHTNVTDACVSETLAYRKYLLSQQPNGGQIQMSVDYVNALIADCEFQTGVKADVTVPPEGADFTWLVRVPPAAPK